MTDFSYLNKLNVNESNVVDYPIVEIEGSPILKLKPANEGNRGYMNALLRSTGQSRGARKTKLKVDSKMMDELRETDRALYAEHILSGWSGILDSKGKEVSFSKEDAVSFLKALPNWIFDSIRTFCTDPENFLATIDSAEKAGN
jgi:hypothetical protein